MLRIISRLLGITWFVVRILAPWITQLTIWALVITTTAIASVRMGIPTTITKIADEWLERALHAGFPPLWAEYLYYPLLTIAFFTVLAGWILLSFIAVFIVNMIFR
jgi:hypothetical protein